MPAGLAGSSGFYVFFFLAIGAHMPFWPLWLSDWGLSAAEIGALTASAVAVRVVAGVALPYAADRAGRPRRALALLSGVGALAFLAHEWAGSRALLYAATILAGAALAGAMPIADALTLRAASRGGFSYALARGIGSAAFLSANLLAGVAVAAYGSGAALWWIVLSLLPCIWFGLRHPGGAGAPLPSPKLAEAAALLRRSDFLLIMFAAASLQGSHAVLYAYGSLHWSAAGIGDGTIGALWAFSVLLEVLLMIFYGRRFIAWAGPAGAMTLAGAAGLIRWAAMALDPPLALLWPLQALHALTFTAAWLGAVAMTERAAPAALGATAQGMVGAMAGGAMMSAAGFAGSFAYPAFGAGAFWIGFGLSLLGALAALRLR